MKNGLKSGTYAIMFLLILVISCKKNRNNSDDSPIEINNSKFPTLTEMKVGSVSPEGWLKDWCLANKSGMLGHLDHEGNLLHPDLNGNWLIDPREGDMIDNKDFWPYEISGQWLEALIRMGYALKDTFLMNKAERQVNAILFRQDVDGYLGWIDHKDNCIPPTAKERWKNGGDSHWGFCPMLRALLAYHSATGDPRIIPAMEKHYQNFYFSLEQITARNKTYEPRIFSNIEVLMELYKRGGDEKILKNALHTMQLMTRDKQKNQVVYTDLLNENYLPKGHGDRYVELVKMYAVAFPFLNDSNFVKASVNGLEKLHQICVLPHGVPEAGEHIVCKKDVNARTEVTTVNNYLYTLCKMIAITGNPSYADRAEKLFFNTAAANVSADCKRTPYYAVGNRINALPFELSKNLHGLEWTELAWTGHNQVNFTRIPGVFVSNMWMKTSDHGLAAVMYGPCSVSGKIGNNQIKLQVNTEYPFSNQISVVVNELQRSSEFPIYFRIPNWCKEYSISVNNNKIEEIEVLNDFIRVKRKWKESDSININIEMEVISKLEYSSNDEQGYPFGYIERGPLLMAFPINSTDDNTPGKNFEFNYVLDFDPEKFDFKTRVGKVKYPFHWQDDSYPVSITVRARRYPWRKIGEYSLPPDHIVESDSSNIREITLVPIACAPFRISYFGISNHFINNLQNN